MSECLKRQVCTPVLQKTQYITGLSNNGFLFVAKQFCSVTISTTIGKWYKRRYNFLINTRIATVSTNEDQHVWEYVKC